MKCKTCGHEVEEKVIQSIPAKKLEWGPTSFKEFTWDDVSGFIEDYYWSGTENSATNPWFVNVSSGNAYTNLKTTSPYVRCVRDIE